MLKAADLAVGQHSTGDYVQHKCQHFDHKLDSRPAELLIHGLNALLATDPVFLNFSAIIQSHSPV